MVCGYVVDSTEYTTYSSTIKYVSGIIILLISVKNELGLIPEYIINEFCAAPCAERFVRAVVQSLVLDVFQ